MLEIKNLSVSYGAIEAVKDISLTVNDGEIVSLIGANGAGKTTTLHTITGLTPAQSGSVMFNGVDLLKTHSNKIVTLGMAHIPEGRHVFTRMSVQENLEMGEIVSLIGANGAGKTTTLHTITGLTPAQSGSVMFNGVDLLKTHSNKIVTLGMAHIPEGRHVFTRMSVQENLEMGAFSLKDRSHMAADLNMVFDYFPRLKERRNQLAGTLSGGEQQMLAMGRALMSHPNTILMDEPSMGLSPLLVKEIFAIIRKLHDEGITVLLVEQNAKMALSIADRAYVLETGRITMEGDAQDLLHDEQVRKAYLGA